MKTKLTRAYTCLFAIVSLFISTSTAIHATPVLNGGFQASKPGPTTVKPFTVSLLFFHGELLEKGLAYLDWAIGEEKDNAYFVIERSTDRREFTTIAEINAVGNSSEVTLYNFIDMRPVKVITYYKLIQFDRDGQSTELQTIEIRPGVRR